MTSRDLSRRFAIFIAALARHNRFESDLHRRHSLLTFSVASTFLSFSKYMCESESIKVLPPLIFREKLNQPILTVKLFKGRVLLRVRLKTRPFPVPHNLSVSSCCLSLIFDLN